MKCPALPTFAAGSNYVTKGTGMCSSALILAANAKCTVKCANGFTGTPATAQYSCSAAGKLTTPTKLPVCKAGK